MKGVRFTKAEREWLVEVLEQCRGSKYRDLVLAKLEAAELPVKKSAGISVMEVIGIFRGVLGNRLIAPPFTAVGVLAQMKNRIAALGLTEALCKQAAEEAGRRWTGPIRAESIVRQADALLAPYFPSRDEELGYRTPLELDDADI